MYHYTECGLPNVYLLNGYTERETKHGKFISFDDIKGLHKTIGTAVIEKTDRLNADEISFLRCEMNLSQKALSALLGVEAITVRKWESGKNPINGSADRLLRAIYKEFVDDFSSVKLIVEKLCDLDSSKNSLDKITLSENENGWTNKINAA